MIAMGTLFQIILTISIVAHHSQHINQHQKVRSCCSALFSSHQTKRKCINFYVNVHRMWQSFHFRTINSTKNPTARNAHFDENVYLHVFVWNASLCPVFFSFYLTNERFIQIAARKTSGQSFVDCRHCSLFSKVKCAIVAFNNAGEVNEVSEIAITFEWIAAQLPSTNNGDEKKNVEAVKQKEWNQMYLLVISMYTTLRCAALIEMNSKWRK